MTRFASLLLLCGMASSLHAQATQSLPEQKYIEQTAKAFVTAFDAGNAGAIANLWTPDGEYSLGGQTLKGRAAIQKQYEELFKANPGATMEIKINSVRKLAPTLIVEDGTASLSDPKGNHQSASSYSVLHVKVDNKWLMADVRESDSLLPPPADELQRLDWMVGDWSSKGENATVDLKFEWVANRQFLQATTTIHPNEKDAKPQHGGIQIIGRDPLTGRIVAWFFNTDGGHAYGIWVKSGDALACQTQGVTAEGLITTATNVMHRSSDKNVFSWQSVGRSLGNEPLPNTEKIVFERPNINIPAAK
jgi:uncharacterized protein (TIGR02246 family)